jgi:hypothetical protein
MFSFPIFYYTKNLKQNRDLICYKLLHHPISTFPTPIRHPREEKNDVESPHGFVSLIDEDVNIPIMNDEK